MSIIGKIFDNQQPQSADHGAIFAKALSDGIVCGCEISASGSNIYIGPGKMLICGRLFELDARQTVGVSGTSGFARLFCEANMNGTATSTSFGQISFGVDYAENISGFEELTKEDINDNGVSYQMEVALATLSTDGVDEIIREIGEVSPAAMNPENMELMTVTFESGSPATANYYLIKA